MIPSPANLRIDDNAEAGEIVISILTGRVWTDHAPTMHAEVISALESNGFDVWPERKVVLNNGRRGRIDIVAHYGGGGVVGIELDCRKPRFKSIAKLHLFNGFRIIATRGVEGHTALGIDACVCMRARFAPKSVKADRRIYRPAPEWAADWKGAP